MCGIAGLVLSQSAPLPSAWIHSALNDIAHRGPDDIGLLTLDGDAVSLTREPTVSVANLVLLHRRLSIIDLSSTGWQPKGSPSGKCFIVFNGEIYNYIELRAELRSLGYEFSSQSDTEVLLAAYEQWGRSAFARLVGMFAAAILDLRMQTLLLVRDFFGIKPLYYARHRDGLAFASEIKPLLRLPGVTRQANPQRLYDYLRFGMTDYGGDTMFADIQQVPPAHYAELSLDKPQSVRLVRYWSPAMGCRRDLSFDEATDHLRELFLDSVRLHLRSDVPVGAALSGGIDSSSIVAAMRHLDKNLEIHTFSYIAESDQLSEERWVDALGAVIKPVVHKVSAGPESMIAGLGHLVDIQGECFPSTSIVAQREVFREARQAGIKVMLDGQGADELFGGYHAYIAARLASLLRQRKFLQALSLLRQASRLPGSGVLWLSLQTMDFLIPSAWQEPFRRLLGREFTPRWIRSIWFTERGVEMVSPHYVPGTEVLRGSLHASVIRTSLPALLRFEDRNSMAFSIESRVPFLTPHLVDFVLTLPEEWIISPDGTTKAILRHAMRGIVPDSILSRHDKIGFLTPEAQWLSSLDLWIESLLASETAMRIGALDLDALRHESKTLLRRRAPLDFRLWRWINLVLWAQRFECTFS